MDASHIRSSVASLAEHLRANPAAAQSKDPAAVAVVEQGLRCRVEGPNGAVVMTDMAKALGGEASAPTPGWMLRAALAACDASMIAVRAAAEGVTLTRLEVAVDSDSDHRGLVGTDEAAPAGPLRIRVHVRISSDAPMQRLRQIVEWAERHSPVGDAIRRSVPTSLDIESI